VYTQDFDPVSDSLGLRRGDLFRKVLGWSLALVLVMCVLVYLQSKAVLEWMVVE
jgi:lactate permease